VDRLSTLAGLVALGVHLWTVDRWRPISERDIDREISLSR
jgi:hypothetical protein